MLRRTVTGSLRRHLCSSSRIFSTLAGLRVHRQPLRDELPLLFSILTKHLLRERLWRTEFFHPSGAVWGRTGWAGDEKRRFQLITFLFVFYVLFVCFTLNHNNSNKNINNIEFVPCCISLSDSDRMEFFMLTLEEMVHHQSFFSNGLNVSFKRSYQSHPNAVIWYLPFICLCQTFTHQLSLSLCQIPPRTESRTISEKNLRRKKKWHSVSHHLPCSRCVS